MQTNEPKSVVTPDAELINVGTVCAANTRTVDIGSGVHQNNVTQPGSHVWQTERSYTSDKEYPIEIVTKFCRDCGHAIRYNIIGEEQPIT